MSQLPRPSHSLDDIYRKLKAGLGHELVDDSNVDELIQMASRQGNETLETILREWKAECKQSGPGATATGTTATGTPTQRISQHAHLRR